MTSTPKPSSKRAPLPRQSFYEKRFTKDWQRLIRSGRYDMNTRKEVMLLLIANNGPLPPEWRDHELVADWTGHRECHAGGDFLLIYRLEGDKIVFVRAGTHADLFD